MLQKDVEALCLKTGFPAAEARIAAAIAMTEAPYSEAGKSYSDFDLVGDQALANSVWGYSYGGFQIRSLISQRGTGGFRDALRLPEPAFNVNSALTIWKAQGFQPWTTYNTGQYKAFLQDLYPPPVGTYIVIPGDSLSKIASTLQIGLWQDLARVNGLHSPYTIYIGQALLLPWFEYVVRGGDTLSAIVYNYGEGVTIARVQLFNNILDANRIYPGQVIRIPRSIL